MERGGRESWGRRGRTVREGEAVESIGETMLVVAVVRREVRMAKGGSVVVGHWS